MDKNNYSLNPEVSSWQLRLSAVALAGLAIAGCSGQTPETPSESTTRPPGASASPNEINATIPPVPSPEASTLTANRDCVAVEVPVFPGSRLKPANANSIQKQLDALKTANTPNEPVGLRAIGNANAIVANALADSTYAEAFAAVNKGLTETYPTAEKLIAATAPSDNDCLSRTQLGQVNELFTTLLDGFGPQAGRQIGAAGRVAYNGLQGQYDDFISRYRQELAG